VRLEVVDSALQAGLSPAGPSREELLAAIRQAQIAYVRASLGREQAELEQGQINALRRHASYLDLLALRVGEEQAADAWHVVGTAYEWLSTLAPTPDQHAAVPSLTRGPIGDLTRASLAYASGLHEASSANAAERALRAFERLPIPDRVIRAAGRVILRFLARRYVDALSAVDDYGQAVQDRLHSDDDPTIDWPMLGAMGRLGEAAACQASAMASGAEDLFETARLRFVEASVAATAVSDDIAALAGRLARVAAGMTDRSTHRVLGVAGLPAPVVRVFAAQRPELWSTQLRTIERGFLDPDRAFVLSLPTGSGKTFLAQLRILATFERYPESWVAYVAPARALVREAHAELVNALRPHGIRVRKVVARAEASSLLGEDELPVVTGDRTCAVLTPERLDLYLRTSPELADRLRLVVVDECHHIATEDRGPRLESLIGLLRSRWPDAKPVLLSASMSNADELQAWLGEDAESFSSTTRPTRQLRGLLVRHNQRRLPDVWLSGSRNNPVHSLTPPQDWYDWHSHRRTYDLGALISTRDDPPNQLPADIRAYALPSITRGTNWTAHRAATGRRRAQVEYNAGTKAADIAVDVGVALAAHPGLVLMFFNSVDGAEKAAERIAARLPLRDDFEPFATAVAAVVGEANNLVECLRHGCAFHHAQMPDDVIRIVEAAALAELEVLCATSGLQAGVNLPASVVVVMGDPRYSPGIKPSARDFANMAGRAGRPGHETEGLALLLPGNITSGSPMPGARGYLAPRPEDTAVVSELGRLLSELSVAETGIALDDLPEAVQQTLLMLWATDVRDPAAVANFFAHTFGGATQAEDLGPDLAAATQRAAEGNVRRFTAFAKTALPYSTHDALVELVPQVIGRFAEEPVRNSPTAQAIAISELLLTVPYFGTKARARLGPAYDSALVTEMVAEWLDGASYEALGQHLGLPRPGRAVRTVNELTGYLAWGTGSLLSLAAAEDELEGSEPMLPYLMRFGVNNRVAAYLRLLGVSDRAGSVAIATRYPERRETDFEAVEAWARSPDGRVAIRDHYADNHVGRTATERDLGIDLEPATAVPISFSTGGDIPDWVGPGTVVRIGRAEDDRWSMLDLVSRSVWLVDSAPGPGIAVISGVDASRLRAVMFEPTPRSA
jgi:hypothetical protein